MSLTIVSVLVRSEQAAVGQARRWRCGALGGRSSQVGRALCGDWPPIQSFQICDIVWTIEWQ